MSWVWEWLASACSSSDDDAPPPLTAGNAESADGLAEVDPVTGTVGFFMPDDSARRRTMKTARPT